MHKKILIATLLIMTARSGFSQTNPQIEKAFNDPKRAEAEAKADVYIHRNPAVWDSTQTSNAVAPKARAVKKRICKKKQSK